MREIKFRAFVDGEMRYDIKTIHYTELEQEIYIVEFWHHDSIIRGLNPINLMQFTGLLDRNGKEIFEGDRVKSPNGLVKVMVFSGGRFGLQWDENTVVLPVDLHKWEIIGTVYDKEAI